MKTFATTPPRRRCPSAAASLAAAAASALLVGAVLPAHATPFRLMYSGSFNSTESLTRASAATPVSFADGTTFTVMADFDDSTPNLAPPAGGPFNGFRAYAPSAVTIVIGDTRYALDPSSGVTVAIFDRNSFTPGRYGIGLIADPAQDGAGFIGDFVSASPDFTVTALTPTVFGDYAGTGHSSGVCLSGNPPACPHAVTPWLLRDSQGAQWLLSLGNYEVDYPAGGIHTAQILAVPEASTAASLFGGMLLLAGVRRLRRGVRS